MPDQDVPTTDPFAVVPAADALAAAEEIVAAEEIAEAVEVAEEIVAAETAEEIAELEVVQEAELIEAEEEGEDPVAALREQMRTAPGDWYVIHSYAGYENKVKGNIETRITTLNMEDYVFQVEVPMEEVTEIKSGVRKLVRRNKFPGYVLVRMDLTDESWGAIRHTPGVTGFVGHGHQPAPLSLDEVVGILAPAPEKKAATPGAAATGGGASAAPAIEVDFAVGDSVTGRRRPFRHPARDRLGDQRRSAEGHRTGGDLRSRDPRRAGLQPDRQELALCTTPGGAVPGAGRRRRTRHTMAPKKKKVVGLIKLQIQAGAANPAPPVGPALGQHGVNIMEFCKAYNAATEAQRGNVIPVEITVYEDRSFEFTLKTPPASRLILKAAGLEKGSSTPPKTKAGSITQAQVREIAETKMPDLNANDVDAAMKIIEGTARQMGITVTA